LSRIDLTPLFSYTDKHNLRWKTHPNIILEGKALTARQTVIGFLFEALGPDGLKSFGDVIYTWESQRMQFIDEVKRFVAAAEGEESAEPLCKKTANTFLVTVPVKDCIYDTPEHKEKDGVVLLNPDYTATRMPLTAYKARVGAKYFNRQALRYAPTIDFKFEPTKDYIYRDSEKPNVAKEVNIYRRPEIYKNPPDEVKDASIEHIIAWLKWFLADEEQRKYVYTWVGHALNTRAKTVLILSGREGTGKTTFATLLKGLINGGEDNDHGYFCKGRLHAKSSRFNDEYNVARILFFDEYKLSTDDQMDFLKELVEDDQSREGKFKKRRTVENTLSILICNNCPNEIMIPPATGRKMSVLDLPKAKMTEVFNEEFRAKLNEEIRNPNSLAKLYFQLISSSNLKRYSNDQPLHTKTYEIMTLRAARQGIMDFLKIEIDDQPISEIFPGKLWTVDEILTYNKQRGQGEKTSESRIISFFEHYKVNGKLVLNLVYSDGPLQVKLTEDYYNYLRAVKATNTNFG